MSDHTIAVLLYAKCPTGQHVGSVEGHRAGTSGKVVLPYPLRYLCGCEHPKVEDPQTP